MKVTREKIVEILINALQEAQQDIVDEPEEITESTRPIGDLKSFDSLASVVVTVHCLAALKWNAPPSFPSLFLGKPGEALTVGEVADRILRLKKRQSREG
ncbi:MAG: hypothetical protein HY787_08575 [Deltaproteobacteria bacterium]|nr:hypothetical protein [Deltaproteobacteria bacterium]